MDIGAKKERAVGVKLTVRSFCCAGQGWSVMCLMGKALWRIAVIR